jgi:hypothetical protein
MTSFSGAGLDKEHHSCEHGEETTCEAAPCRVSAPVPGSHSALRYKNKHYFSFVAPRACVQGSYPTLALLGRGTRHPAGAFHVEASGSFSVRDTYRNRFCR